MDGFPGPAGRVGHPDLTQNIGQTLRATSSVDTTIEFDDLSATAIGTADPTLTPTPTATPTSAPTATPTPTPTATPTSPPTATPTPTSTATPTPFPPPPAPAAELSGELQVWRPVALTVVGPDSAEDSTPNPFLDARMDVTFTQAGRSITVPGFFAADGAAADTSAAAGNRWRVYFTPDAAGPWEYRVSFWRGPGVAVADDPLAGSPVEGSDGLGGSFSVAEPLPDEPGMLRYAGGHHVRRAGSGEFFLKGGADSPENFLAFHEFDQTPPKHRYEPHVADFRAGDPTWQGGKGMGILGALNYLAGEGMNSVYFLTMNVGGDGRDVWPWTASAERERFDVSKLAQ